jgi:dTDP-4-dehydrorhamnose reductase
LFLAQTIKDLIKEEHLKIDGLLHICGETISKYQMLCLFKEVFEKNDVEISVDYGPGKREVNRSLVSLRNPGIKVPYFKEMLQQLKEFD